VKNQEKRERVPVRSWMDGEETEKRKTLMVEKSGPSKCPTTRGGKRESAQKTDKPRGGGLEEKGKRECPSHC